MAVYVCFERHLESMKHYKSFLQSSVPYQRGVLSIDEFPSVCSVLESGELVPSA